MPLAQLTGVADHHKVAWPCALSMHTRAGPDTVGPVCAADRRRPSSNSACRTVPRPLAQGSLVALTGSPGMGKSAVLSVWLARCNVIAELAG